MSDRSPTAAHEGRGLRIATMSHRSEILDEGFQIRAPDCRAVKDMQACGINEVTDFLAEAIRNLIKADFQSLDDGLLLGKNLPSFLAFLPTFLP